MTKSKSLIAHPSRVVVRSTPLAAALLALSLLVRGTAAAQDAPPREFRVTIDRQSESPECTAGTLLVNDERVCRTIELPWRENQARVSSIPPGKYGASLRYDHADQWRLQLAGVPGRSAVQIHVGNFTSDSEGCILVGNELAEAGCSIKAGTSAPAYDSLRTRFYGSATPNATPNRDIVVEVLPTRSLLGVWESTDVQRRWRLKIEAAGVAWSERNEQGVELVRTIQQPASDYAVRLERPNDAEVLAHLGYSAEMVQAILRAGPQPSWIEARWDRAVGAMTATWHGLIATKDAQGHLLELRQPGSVGAPPKSYTLQRR